MKDFTDEEKKKFFEIIAEKYYNCNFGQISKAYIDVLMFSFYIQHMVNDNKEKDGTIDYRKISDYNISKELGITETQVRNLKVKSQLLYKIEFDWEKAFASLVKNARYDEDTKKVVMSIPDPNLLREIEHQIEENGAFIEKQLNSKILQIRVEYFLDLLCIMEPEERRKTVRKEMAKQLKEHIKDEKLIDDHFIGKSLIKLGVNITETLANVSGILSPTNPLLNPLKALLAF